MWEWFNLFCPVTVPRRRGPRRRTVRPTHPRAPSGPQEFSDTVESQYSNTVGSQWGRCRTVRARCAHGACTVRARFNVFGMVAQLVPR